MFMNFFPRGLLEKCASWTFAAAAPALFATGAAACSCNWGGPFLTAAQDAPLVVRGKILRHHPGKPPIMDVLALETIKGGLLDSGLAVQLGDGMYCRPAPEVFPPGTEWVLAINGKGAKPGSGLAISHCGEYWLRVERGRVSGSIDGNLGQVKSLPLSEFRLRFLYPRFSEKFSGRAEAGKRFRRYFGPHFEFLLEPRPDGWLISVREPGGAADLSRLTPPLHFVPNPREIEGWQLSGNPSACKSRPYGARSGPDNPRKFVFSPEAKPEPSSSENPSAGQTEPYGKGELTIDRFQLSPGGDGCPGIAWMEFSVRAEGGARTPGGTREGK